MTPADIIREARVLVNDTVSPERYSDSIMLAFVNQTLKRMSAFRPDLFLHLGEVDTVAGTVVQSMPSNSIRLVDIFGVKGGDAITEVERATYDRVYPGWRSQAAGTPKSFMRHARNPNMYFLSPRPQANIKLLAEYAMVPPTFAATATITGLSNVYMPVLVDGVVYLAESIDDEHVNSGRAKLFLDAFVQGLGATLEARNITDSESINPAPRGATQ